MKWSVVNTSLGDMIVSGFVGTVIGLFVGRLLDRPLEKWQRRAR
ncbi:MAG: hypothetical protein ACLPX5_01675 [Dissulfurispiraceae bacterium]